MGKLYALPAFKRLSRIIKRKKWSCEQLKLNALGSGTKIRDP